MLKHDFIAINPTVVEVFQSGAEWWSVWPAIITNRRVVKTEGEKIARRNLVCQNASI